METLTNTPQHTTDCVWVKLWTEANIYAKLEQLSSLFSSWSAVDTVLTYTREMQVEDTLGGSLEEEASIC